MKSNSLNEALRKAKILDSLREVVSESPPLQEIIHAFQGYVSLLPEIDGRPFVVECLAVANTHYRRAARNVRIKGATSPEIAFLTGLFEAAPRLLDQSICAPSHVDGEFVCWVPFAESITDFLSRYPGATLLNEPCPERQMMDDAELRQLMAARILPVNWAKAFLNPDTRQPENEITVLHA